MQTDTLKQHKTAGSMAEKRNVEHVAWRILVGEQPSVYEMRRELSVMVHITAWR